MKKPIVKYSKPWWIGFLVINLLLALGCTLICEIGGGIIGILVLVVGGILAVVLAVLGLFLLFKGAWIFTLLCWAGTALLGFLILSSSDWVFHAALVIMAVYILCRYRKSTLAFNPASGTKLGTAIRITSLIYPGVMALAFIISVFWYRRDGSNSGSFDQLKAINALLYYVGGGCWIAHTIMMFCCAVKAWRKGEDCPPSA